MGVKIYAERRYSEDEKRDIKDADLMRCATENAIKVVKFQVDPNSDTCKFQNIIDERTSTSNISRQVVSTLGTFITKKDGKGRNLYTLDPDKGDYWTKLIASMIAKNKFVPRVLKREMLFILRYVLYELSNFTNIHLNIKVSMPTLIVSQYLMMKYMI